MECSFAVEVVILVLTVLIEIKVCDRGAFLQRLHLSSVGLNLTVAEMFEPYGLFFGLPTTSGEAACKNCLIEQISLQ